MRELIRNLLLCGLLACVGLGVAYYYPLTRLKFERSGDHNLVSVFLTRKILGLLPIEERWLQSVKGVSLGTQRDTGTVALYLETLEGKVLYSEGIPLGANTEVERINRFVADDNLPQFSTWKVNWPWFLLACFLSAGSLVLSVMSIWQYFQTLL